MIAKKSDIDLLGLNLPVPSITSWRAEIDGKRFSGMNEVNGSFWGYLAEGGERFRVKVYRQHASNVGPNH